MSRHNHWTQRKSDWRHRTETRSIHCTSQRDSTTGNEFNEIDLQRLTDELTTMTRELTQPKNISLEEDSRVLINDIRVKVDIANEDSRWRSQANTGTIIAGGNGNGKGIDQLNYPTDVLVDKRDHSIIIADQGNRRVVKWFERSGTRPQILIDNIDCFGLAMDKEGFLYVSDREKSEVRRWKEEETEGIVVAGGNGEGDRLNQLNYPRFLFVDDEQTVYVSDWRNNRVMKWRRGATKGIIVAGGNGQGDRLNNCIILKDCSLIVGEKSMWQTVRIIE
ncbi:unnamed protein product [Sphagnum troendelagicum]|uniref:NHL repeat-containing protein n=1 Tax=Sphagnum troendelagicum TaxID=128251 RepID=A0ABP0T6W3_9BRYO